MPDTASQPQEGAPPDPLIGRTLANKYRLDKLLGAGGMGAVYKARQLALEKTIAVKIMHSELAADPMFAARFHREAKAASQLDHVNSIGILDFGEEPDGLLYIAMEYLDGRDLLAIVEQEAPLPTARIVDVLTQALSALAVAHDLGIIHRDLKPENIMVLRRKGEDDQVHEVVKVCDFGIAKVADVAEPEEAAPARAKKGKLTTAGLVIGTPEYMSPEQGRGEALDPRCDLYSMGVILYLLLSGQTPFDAPTPLGIVLKHQTEEPLPPSRFRPAPDLRLETVCLKAMSKRPADRYANARDMRAALRAALDGTLSESGLATHRTTSASVDAPRTVVTPATQVAGNGAARINAVAETAAFPMAAPAEMTAPPAIAPATTAAPFTKLAAQASPPPSRVGLKVAGAALVVGALAAAAFFGRGLFMEGGGGQVASARPTSAPPPVAPPAHASPAQPETPALPAPVAHSEALLQAPLNQPSSMKREKGTPLGAQPPVGGGRPALGEAVVAANTAPPADPVPPSPPPVAPAPAPLPAVVPDPPPPARPFDSSAARVSEGTVTVLSGGVNPRAVAAAINVGKITGCYRSSATDASPEGTFVLRIATDDSGNIVEGRLDGPMPDAVKSCISRTVLRSSIKADTGVVTASVPLTFKLR